MTAHLRALVADSKGLSALEYGVLGAIVTAVVSASSQMVVNGVTPLLQLMADGLAP